MATNITDNEFTVDLTNQADAAVAGFTQLEDITNLVAKRLANIDAILGAIGTNKVGSLGDLKTIFAEINEITKITTERIKALSGVTTGVLKTDTSVSAYEKSVENVIQLLNKLKTVRDSAVKKFNYTDGGEDEVSEIEYQVHNLIRALQNLIAQKNKVAGQAKINIQSAKEDAEATKKLTEETKKEEEVIVKVVKAKEKKAKVTKEATVETKEETVNTKKANEELDKEEKTTEKVVKAKRTKSQASKAVTEATKEETTATKQKAEAVNASAQSEKVLLEVKKLLKKVTEDTTVSTKGQTVAVRELIAETNKQAGALNTSIFVAKDKYLSKDKIGRQMALLDAKKTAGVEGGDFFSVAQNLFRDREHEKYNLGGLTEYRKQFSSLDSLLAQVNVTEEIDPISKAKVKVFEAESGIKEKIVHGMDSLLTESVEVVRKLGTELVASGGKDEALKSQVTGIMSLINKRIETIVGVMQIIQDTPFKRLSNVVNVASGTAPPTPEKTTGGKEFKPSVNKMANWSEENVFKIADNYLNDKQRGEIFLNINRTKEEADKQNKIIRDIFQDQFEVVKAILAHNTMITKDPLFVRGEKGTGKTWLLEQLAQAVGGKEGYSKLYSISGAEASLAASNIFGFPQNHATGKGVRTGMLEQVQKSGGILVIDEFFKMDRTLQDKFLGILSQEGQYFNEATQTHMNFYEKGAKLIFSSQEDVKQIEALVKKGRFSSDLYERVNKMPSFDTLKIKSLNEMKDPTTGLLSEDIIKGYTNFFMGRMAAQMSNAEKQIIQNLRISPDLLKQLQSFDYTNKNIRFLEGFSKSIVTGVTREPQKYMTGVDSAGAGQYEVTAAHMSSFLENNKQLIDEEKDITELYALIEKTLLGASDAGDMLSKTNTDMSKTTNDVTAALQAQNVVLNNMTLAVDKLTQAIAKLNRIESTIAGGGAVTGATRQRSARTKGTANEATNIVDDIIVSVTQSTVTTPATPIKRVEETNPMSAYWGLDNRQQRINFIQTRANQIDTIKATSPFMIDERLKELYKERKDELYNSYQDLLTKEVETKKLAKSFFGDSSAYDDIVKHIEKETETERKRQEELIYNKYAELKRKTKSFYDEQIAAIEAEMPKDYKDELDKLQAREYASHQEKLAKDEELKRQSEKKIASDTRMADAYIKAEEDRIQKEHDRSLRAKDKAMLEELKAKEKAVAEKLEAEARLKIDQNNALLSKSNILQGKGSFEDMVTVLANSTRTSADEGNVKGKFLDTIFVPLSQRDYLGNKDTAVGTYGIGTEQEAAVLLHYFQKSMLAAKYTMGNKAWATGDTALNARHDEMIGEFEKMNTGNAKEVVHGEKFKEFVLKYKDMFDEMIVELSKKLGVNAVTKLRAQMEAIIQDQSMTGGVTDATRNILGRSGGATIISGISDYDRRNPNSNKPLYYGSTELNWLKEMYGFTPSTVPPAPKSEGFMSEITNPNKAQSVFGNFNNLFMRIEQARQELPELVQIMNTSITKIAFSFSRLAFGVQIIVMNLSLLKGAFMGTFGYALNKSIELTKAIVEQTEVMDRARIVLTGVFGKGQATDMLKFAKEYAVTSPATFEEITNMIKSFGLTPQIRESLKHKQGEALKETLKDLSDVTITLGMSKPEQGVQGAMFALREALAGQWRSLKMRFEIMPQAVAASIGASVKEIEKSPELLTRAFKKFWQISFGEDTLKTLSLSVKVQIQNIYDFIEQLSQKIGDSGFYKHLQKMTSTIASAFKGLLDSSWLEDTAKSFSATLIEYSDTLFNTARGFLIQVLDIKSVSESTKTAASKSMSKGELKPEQLTDYMLNAEVIKATTDAVRLLYIEITGGTKNMTRFAGMIAQLFKENKSSIISFIKDVVSAVDMLIKTLITLAGYYAKAFKWIMDIKGDNLISTITKLSLILSMVFPIASMNIFINGLRIIVQIFETLIRRDLYVKLFDFINKLSLVAGAGVNTAMAVAGMTGLSGVQGSLSFLNRKTMAGEIAKVMEQEALAQAAKRALQGGDRETILDNLDRARERATVMATGQQAAQTGADAFTNNLTRAGALIRFTLAGFIVGGFLLGAKNGTGTFLDRFKTGMETVVGIVQTAIENIFGTGLMADLAEGTGLLGILFPEFGWLMVKTAWNILTADMLASIQKMALMMSSSFGAVLITFAAGVTAVALSFLEIQKFHEADWRKGQRLRTSDTLENDNAYLSMRSGSDNYTDDGTRAAKMDAMFADTNKSLYKSRKSWVEEMLNSGQNIKGLVDAGLVEMKNNQYKVVTSVIESSESYDRAVETYTKSNEAFYGSMKNLEDGGVSSFFKNIGTNYDSDIENYIVKPLSKYFGIIDKTKKGKETLESVAKFFNMDRFKNPAEAETKSATELAEVTRIAGGVKENAINRAIQLIEIENRELGTQKLLIEDNIKLIKRLKAAKEGKGESAEAVENVLSDISRRIGSAQQMYTTTSNPLTKYYQETKAEKQKAIDNELAVEQKGYDDFMKFLNKTLDETVAMQTVILSDFDKFINSIIDKIIGLMMDLKNLLPGGLTGWLMGSLGFDMAGGVDSIIAGLNGLKMKGHTPTATEKSVLSGLYDTVVATIAGAKEQHREAQAGGKAKREQVGGGGGADKAKQLAEDYAQDMRKLNKEYFEATNQLTRARIQGAKDDYEVAIAGYKKKYEGYKDYQQLMTYAEKVEGAKRAKAQQDALMDVYGKVEKQKFMPSELRQEAYRRVQENELNKQLADIQSIIDNNLLPEFAPFGAKLAEALKQGYLDNLRENAHKLQQELYKNLVGDTFTRIQALTKDNTAMSFLSRGQKVKLYGTEAELTKLDTANKLAEINYKYETALQSIKNMSDTEVKSLGITREKLISLQNISAEYEKQAEIQKSQLAIQELQLRQTNDYAGAFKLGMNEAVRNMDSGFDTMKKGGETFTNSLRDGLSEALTKTILKEGDSIKDIWANLWKDLVRTMVKILTDTIVNSFIKGLFNTNKVEEEGQKSPEQQIISSVLSSSSNKTAGIQSLGEGFNGKLKLDESLMTTADAVSSLGESSNSTTGIMGELANMEQNASSMAATALDTLAEAAYYAAEALQNISSSGGGGEDGEDGGILEDVLGVVAGGGDGGDYTDGVHSPFRKFATGGVVSSPTMAVIGEGSTSEAVVPLPNNRAIPVDMKNNAQGNPVEVTVINLVDESSINAIIAKNPNTIVNVISADMQQNGQTTRIMRSKLNNR